MTVIPDIRCQRISSTNLMPNHTEHSLYCTLRLNQTCQISQKQPTVQNYKKYVHNKIRTSLRSKTLFLNISSMLCTYEYFYKPARLMQLLLTYTQFWYLGNFYLLLTSFSSSTFLYIVNVLQYHWQLRHWWSRGNLLPLSTSVRRFKPSQRCQEFSG
jgi:hypothetical protein